MYLKQITSYMYDTVQMLYYLCFTVKEDHPSIPRWALQIDSMTTDLLSNNMTRHTPSFRSTFCLAPITCPILIVCVERGGGGTPTQYLNDLLIPLLWVMFQLVVLKMVDQNPGWKIDKISVDCK